MNTKLTQKAQNVLNEAMNEARSLGHTYIGSEHLLLGLSKERESAASKMLKAKGASFDRIRGAVINMSGKGTESSVGARDMTPCLKKIIEDSASLSSDYGQSYIGTEHLLLAALSENDAVAVKLLESCGVQASELKADITVFLGGISERSKSSQKASKNEIKQISALSGFGRDLTEAAKLGRIDPVIGRVQETARVIQILSRRTKNNPCLIGEPGVGKTAVVEGLAQKIANGDVPEPLKDKKIIVLDIPSMIAGAKYRGEFEERMKNVMNEVAKRPEIILFIDEIHTVIGAGAAEGAVDAANIIKPALARGEMRMIGATTIEEYRLHIEKDAAFERRFQPVSVNEPNVYEAKNILLGLREKFEDHHKLKILDEAIDAAVTLSNRYIPDRFLPDKAIDLLDESAARIRISNSTEPNPIKQTEDKLAFLEREKEEAISSQDFEKAAEIRDHEKNLRDEYEKNRDTWANESDRTILTVTAADIKNTVSYLTGIPLGELEGKESQQLLDLEETLKTHIIGQDAAIKAVSNAVRRGRTGLSDPNRPIGSFIFLGPTGVGKTELAIFLAEAIYGDKNALIRLDMSEFMEKHSVSKLIGSPPGYVGHEEGGYLTEKVKRRPYSLVLFDEIEKAHPDIFNILLQILDDGKLTDSSGRTVDFKNTIIIMTSNLGSDREGRKHLGFSAISENDNITNLLDELKGTFRPEFLNRVDEIIKFIPLSDESLLKISQNMLDSLAKRAGSVGVTLSFDSSVEDLIVKEGKDVRYGARPLRRAVTNLVGNPFSEAMLRGEINVGDSVTAFAEENKVIFR